MKSPLGKTLSLILSLMLAFGCFAVVPASAVEVDENGKVGNVTLVDYGQEGNSQTETTFDEKIAMLNVESQYTGTNLKLAGNSNPWLAANYPKAQNRIVGAKHRAALAEGYTALSSALLGKVTDGLIFDVENKDSYDYTSGSYWYDGNLKNKFDPSTNVGAARKENNNVDLYFTTELDAVTDISAIYYFGHPSVNLNACTYEIYVGNDLGDNLYKSENLVAYYDYSSATNDRYVFNGNNSANRRSQGEIWSFTGDSKPRGKYVGFKVYDACLDSTNNRLDVYDVGVFGESRATLVDCGSDTNVTFSQKKSHLTVDSVLKDTTVNVGGITNAYLAENGFTADKNLVKQITFTGKTTVSHTSGTFFEASTDGTIFDIENNVQSEGKAWGNCAFDQLNNLNEDGAMGLERVKQDKYEMTATFTLNKTTEIDSFLYFGHPDPYLNAATYEIYVGSDLSTLYNTENKVTYWDYLSDYKTAGISNVNLYGYAFNGAANAGVSRRSQGAIYTFNGEKPVGKYVGMKIYDASLTLSNQRLDMREVGVFGTEIATAADYISVETVSNSSKTANLMPATTAYVKDTEGNAVEVLKEGSTYTFGVNDTDARYTFEGWYKNGVNVSSDKEYTAEFDGTELVAKYTTDAILNINPAAGNELVWTQANGVVGAFAYDSAKNAYKFNTTTDGNSSTIGSLKYGNVNLLSNQYEANTTYKITVKGEVVDNTPDDGNDAAVKFALSPSVYGNLSYNGAYEPSAAFTATKYFYSGAADWGRDSNVIGDAVSTKFISTNSFNLCLVGTKKVDGVDTNYNLLNYAGGDEFYITEFTIEKVNNLVVNADEGADVKVNNKVENRNIAFSTLTADFLKANGKFAQSADITDTEPSFKDVVAKMKSDFAEANIKCGIANDDELSFTATAKDGYTVKSVSVNGKELTIAENGKYMLSGSDIANGKTAGTGRFASDSVVVDVVTERDKAQYTVSFVGKDGKEFYNTTVTEGEAVSADTIAAAAAKAPAIYGYTFKGFDKDAELQNVTANLTVTAVYEKAESTETYTVGYTGVNGKRFEKTGVKFDERVIVTDENAKYWTDGAGAVIAIGTTATIYGCADIELIAKADDAAAEPTATTLGFKTVAGTTSSFVVFGHINVPAGYTVTEKGVVFASKATDEAGEWGIDSAKTAKAVVTGTGVDFMGTLTGINAGKARAAKAYAVLSNGETTVTVYGAVVTAQF